MLLKDIDITGYSTILLVVMVLLTVNVKVIM